jgi:hypothetical protein
MSAKKIILYSQSGQRPGEGNASGSNFFGHGGLNRFHASLQLLKREVFGVGVYEDHLVPILFEKGGGVEEV